MNRDGNVTTHFDSWRVGLLEALTWDTDSVHLVGVGNPIRRDDAVGLEIVTRLHSLLGGAPPGLRIHGISPMPERLLSRLASKGGKVIIFDAIEAAKHPGTIVCSRLGDTKYGFFATHNVPIRLVPGMATKEDNFYIVGVQPKSIEIGEGLTRTVCSSVTKIVSFIVGALEAGR